jgi:hypothetical protein
MTRKALLVGINRYPNAPLRGCLSDVETMADHLVEKWGWNHSDIRLLTDKRATTKAIRERLEWLVEFATPGDTLLFHYSGHGAQMSIRSTAGGIGTMHDCICPVDFDWSPERAMLDMDFADIFADIPKGVSLTWVSDSCHSGDLARTYLCNNPDSYRMPRSFPIPADIAWRNATAIEARVKPVGFARSIEHLHGVLLAGCKSEQTSADAFIEGKYCGAFTTALLTRLSDTNGRLKSNATIVAEANDWLEARGFEQDPQVKGDPEHVAKPWLWTDNPEK